jgi:hypothetical protein
VIETRSGKPSRWRPQRRPQGDREPIFGRRLAIVYDVTGPKVRLGVLWFLLALFVVRWGPFPTALVYGAVASVAALQTVRAWKYHRLGAHTAVAATVAGLLPIAAAIGTGFLGLVVLLSAGAAYVAALYDGKDRDGSIIAGALTLRCSVPVGLAAASMVLAVRLDISVALVLLLFVSAYEFGDYLVGSGADNSWEGPVAGIVSILCVNLILAVFRVPPFHGPDSWAFAALAAVCCPLGQFAGSIVLPDAAAKAPALRRLDSLLVLGLAWVWLVGLYIGRMGV